MSRKEYGSDKDRNTAQVVAGGSWWAHRWTARVRTGAKRAHLERSGSWWIPQDHAPRREDVWEVQDARDQRAAHEAELNGDGQPRSGAVRKVPLRSQLWDHRGRRKPGRHRQDEGLGERDF